MNVTLMCSACQDNMQVTVLVGAKYMMHVKIRVACTTHVALARVTGKQQASACMLHVSNMTCDAC